MKNLIDNAKVIILYKPNKKNPYSARGWKLEDYKVTVTDYEVVLESDKGNYVFNIKDYMKTWRLL